MRRDERGIVVPCMSSPTPWAIKTGDSSEDCIREHDKEYDAGTIVDSDGVYVASVWSEDDLPFITHAANYHERLASFVRRFAETTEMTVDAWDRLMSEAEILWDEMKEDK